MPGVSALKMIISFLRWTVGQGCFFVGQSCEMWDSWQVCKQKSILKLVYGWIWSPRRNNIYIGGN